MILKGEGIGRNMGSGKLALYRSDLTLSCPAGAGNALARYEEALKKGFEALERMERESASDGGSESAAVFEAHKMLLADEGLDLKVRALIAEGRSAEESVCEAYDKMTEMLQNTGDSLIALRAADLQDLKGLLLAGIRGTTTVQKMPEEPYILLAEDLLPGELMRLDRSYLRGVVLMKGSRLSHIAILLREFGIPAVILIGGDLDAHPAKYEEFVGLPAVVDSEEGVVYLDADERSVSKAAEGSSDRNEKAGREAVQVLKYKFEDVVVDCESAACGHVPAVQSVFAAKREYKYKLLANVSTLEEARRAASFGAAGIGLLRSEFLFLQMDRMPTEEEQYIFYREVLESMQGRPVTVRTLDLGGDKLPNYLKELTGEDPSLRGSRLGLQYPELYRTQLRALYRAAHFGKLKIMFPLITSCEEVRALLSLAENVREELMAEGIEVPRVPLGIMIETKEAVEQSEELASMADFFSIGTNDLGRALAEECSEERSEEAFTQVILSMIDRAVRAAHGAGIAAGICGELAADPACGEIFEEFSVDELSMNPAALTERFFTINR